MGYLLIILFGVMAISFDGHALNYLSGYSGSSGQSRANYLSGYNNSGRSNQYLSGYNSGRSVVGNRGRPRVQTTVTYDNQHRRTGTRQPQKTYGQPLKRDDLYYINPKVRHVAQQQEPRKLGLFNWGRKPRHSASEARPTTTVPYGLPPSAYTPSTHAPIWEPINE